MPKKFQILEFAGENYNDTGLPDVWEGLIYWTDDKDYVLYTAKDPERFDYVDYFLSHNGDPGNFWKNVLTVYEEGGYTEGINEIYARMLGND